MVKWVVMVLLLVADLLSKHLVFQQINIKDKLEIFPGLYFHLAKNYGLGFGLAQGWNEWILVPNILVLLFVFYQFLKKNDSKQAWTFILAGGLANCYDRFYFGYVRDFILLSWKGLSWPVFNLADIYIFIAFLFLLIEIKSEEAAEQKIKIHQEGEKSYESNRY